MNRAWTKKMKFGSSYEINKRTTWSYKPSIELEEGNEYEIVKTEL